MTNPASATLLVASGETLELAEDTRLASLTVEEGGRIVAPDGRQVTLTVHGIETGSVLGPSPSAETHIGPGHWFGDVVLTVTEDNTAEAMGSIGHLRQAAYVDRTGLVAEKSATAALLDGVLDGTTISGAVISSNGEAFNGIVVADGDYTITDPVLTFVGHGRSDFTAQGTGITVRGAGARARIEGLRFFGAGMQRSGVVAHGGARLVVKDSDITTADLPLPPSWEDVLGDGMVTVPWPLGLHGSVRAVCTLGDDTRATYLNSRIVSTSWALLGADAVGSTKMFDPDAPDLHLVGINVDGRLAGTWGYGVYSDSNCSVRLSGTHFEGVSHGAIISGGRVWVDGGDLEAVRSWNTELELGLTEQDLAEIDPRATRIDSTMWGFLLHQHAHCELHIRGDVAIRTGRTVFTVKEVDGFIEVDGSAGATIESRSGVLYQLMDGDDPIMVTGDMTRIDQEYDDPEGPVERVEEWDVSRRQDGDATLRLTDVALAGDVFNSRRGGVVPPPPPLPEDMPADRPSPFPGKQPGQNLVVELERASLTGVISASGAVHPGGRITRENRDGISVVQNTVQPAVNNGVIVTLGAGSTWTVTGESHLTSLRVDEGAQLVCGGVTVDGVARDVAAGETLVGSIVVAAL